MIIFADILYTLAYRKGNTGKYDKVKALQHLIANSFDSNVIAVRKVTETSEKRIVGVNCLIQYLHLIVKHLTF